MVYMEHTLRTPENPDRTRTCNYISYHPSHNIKLKKLATPLSVLLVGLLTTLSATAPLNAERSPTPQKRVSFLLEGYARLVREE